MRGWLAAAQGEDAVGAEACRCDQAVEGTRRNQGAAVAQAQREYQGGAAREPAAQSGCPGQGRTSGSWRMLQAGPPGALAVAGIFLVRTQPEAGPGSCQEGLGKEGGSRHGVGGGGESGREGEEGDLRPQTLPAVDQELASHGPEFKSNPQPLCAVLLEYSLFHLRSATTAELSCLNGDHRAHNTENICSLALQKKFANL